MRGMLNLLRRFQNDEDGAALVEYTVLLGILLIAVIATIVGCRHLDQRRMDRVEHGAARELTKLDRG